LDCCEQVRGIGLVLAIEFAADKTTREAFPTKWAVGTYFGGQCAANGVLVRVSGDIIMIAPPLIISADEVHKMVKTAELALKETEKYVSEKQANNPNVHA
jgi:4-aminobutyrate--pyruvate transaminase